MSKSGPMSVPCILPSTAFGIIWLRYLGSLDSIHFMVGRHNIKSVKKKKCLIHKIFIRCVGKFSDTGLGQMTLNLIGTHCKKPSTLFMLCRSNQESSRLIPNL